MVTFLRVFFFNDTATTEIYTLSLHDALPICSAPASRSSSSRYGAAVATMPGAPWHHCSRIPLAGASGPPRSEEHTSELQPPCNLECRLLLEKKNTNETMTDHCHRDLLDCHLP